MICICGQPRSTPLDRASGGAELVPALCGHLLPRPPEPLAEAEDPAPPAAVLPGQLGWLGRS